MKLLLINSSARISGNTGRVMDLYEKAFASLSRELGVTIEVERVNLARVGLNTCLGCRACFDLGEEKCPLRDELLPRGIGCSQRTDTSSRVPSTWRTSTA